MAFRSRITAAASLALALILTLSACMPFQMDPGGRPHRELEPAASSTAQPDQFAQQNPGGAVTGSSALQENRAFATSSSMWLRSNDVAGTAEKVRGIVHELDGRIEVDSAAYLGDGRHPGWGPGGVYAGSHADDGVYAPGHDQAMLTIQVPAGRHDELLAQLRQLGEPVSVKTRSEDVTLLQADVHARIETLKTSLAGLRKLMQQQGSVSDLLEVEREITAREAELQSLRDQAALLKEQTETSTLELTISDQHSNRAPGWLKVVLPVLLLLMITAGAVTWFLVRRTRTRRRTGTTASVTGTPEKSARPSEHVPATGGQDASEATPSAAEPDAR